MAGKANLPIGIEDFGRIRKDGFYYVEISPYIYHKDPFLRRFPIRQKVFRHCLLQRNTSTCSLFFDTGPNAGNVTVSSKAEGGIPDVVVT